MLVYSEGHGNAVRLAVGVFEQEGVEVAVFVATQVRGLDAGVWNEASWDKAVGLMGRSIDSLHSGVVVQGLEHESFVGRFFGLAERDRAFLTS